MKEIDHPVHLYRHREVIDSWEKRQLNYWRSMCFFVGQSDMSNLEFRLYYGIPAWLFYKQKKAMKNGKIKWRRFNMFARNTVSL